MTENHKEQGYHRSRAWEKIKDSTYAETWVNNQDSLWSKITGAGTGDISPCEVVETTMLIPIQSMEQKLFNNRTIAKDFTGEPIKIDVHVWTVYLEDYSMYKHKRKIPYNEIITSWCQDMVDKHNVVIQAYLSATENQIILKVAPK